MIAIRKHWWSALALAAFTGCGNEPGSTTPPPASTTPAPTTTTNAPETTNIPPPTTPPADMKPETTPPAAATDLPKIDAPQPTPATKDDEKKDDAKKPEDKAAAATVSLASEEVAELKKLDEKDAEKALKQLVCPVSGENLGSMGVPVKVTAMGQSFFLCCKGCNKDVKDDPATVVAKLRK